MDFEFHHLITLASDNSIYPLLMNTMRKIYTNLTRQFFEDPFVVPRVFTFHSELVKAIKAQNDSLAVKIMKKILKHGEKQFILLLNGRKQEAR